METREQEVMEGSYCGVSGQSNKSLELPSISTISEWFSADHKERINRLRAATKPTLGPYMVYEVYNSKGSL